MSSRRIMRLAQVLLLLLSGLDATMGVGEKNLRRLGDELPSSGTTSISSTQDGTVVSRSHRRLHPAFSKCWDTLLDSSADPDRLTRQEFITFLQSFELTDEDQATFQDLGIDYVAMFYSAACRADRDCSDGEPSVELTLEPGSGRSRLVGLCYNILERAITDVEFTFEVTVQFDPLSVPTDQVGVCLEAAVQSTVLDTLGCPETNSRRKLKSLSTSDTEILQDNGGSTRNRQRRNKQVLDDWAFVDDDNRDEETSLRRLNSDGSCQFQISSQIVPATSFFLNCLHQDGQKCGQAVLKVGVQTSQLLAPYADELEHATVKALHQAVEGKTFGEFFPSFCGDD
mmetsp:Transcript_22141/g.47963  ORF Transcript_22141/g.47963 Transcript_22141/m.47963 type:complete len:341 (+) Transcript_22141:108-1130(+)